MASDVADDNNALAARYVRADEGAVWGLVAKGSFGKVFAARDRETGEIVAVKRQRLPSDEATRELAFYKALSQVATPHVQRMLCHFIQAPEGAVYLYLVFPFAENSLQRLWAHHKGLLAANDARRYLHHATLGVSELHANGVTTATFRWPTSW